ncbi:MAG: ABC transporter ATP-binding protein [Rhodobacteraceae bacterium]|nr:ABC transporter ATP-binding protein [Paracoccaceae bacterium]
MARVELKSLNKIYGSGSHSVHAVQDLDLDIADGEFVALLGPSGCGKTSTLRMIVGLESVSSGEILFDGVSVTHREPQGRNVAMAFETYALYPNFTVEENLAFPLEVRGLDAATRRRKSREIAEILQITDILGATPPELSGGQQQRVSLGRALIRDPSVFILDEVMSHLDAHLKFQMMFDLKRLHRELGRTIVYVTHDQVEALALADRVAVMSDARMQQVGDRNTLYNRPTNVFVADFIGEPPTNFFKAEVRIGKDRPVLVVPDSDIRLTPGPAMAQAVMESGRSAVIAGIRPQSLHLSQSQGALQARVAINEYLGERSMLTVTNGSARFQCLAPPEVRAGVGETVQLDYSPDSIMVFDPESEALMG